MTIEQQALALVNEVNVAGWLPHEIERIPNFTVLCVALERHEAFRQEVSEAAQAVVRIFPHHYCGDGNTVETHLSRFIIAPPVDPLKLAVQDVWNYAKGCEHMPAARASELRAALAKHGLQITGVET